MDLVLISILLRVWCRLVLLFMVLGLIGPFACKRCHLVILVIKKGS